MKKKKKIIHKRTITKLRLRMNSKQNKAKIKQKLK